MNPKVKIFVSHRIDKKSKTIDNPLFENIRCGATFDKDDSTIIGDDTGDNISDKRKTFCELTVQYWAWKNVEADYYGFCHYRRFLSFSDRGYKENEFGVVEYPLLDDTFIERFNLDEKIMIEEIEKYDIIAGKYCSLKKDDRYKSVYDYIKKNDLNYNSEDVETLFQVVKELYPDFLKDVVDFFNGDMNCWYNCYVMKADIFKEYSKWLFDILFEFEKRIDVSNYTQEQLRICGTMAERLLGAYLERMKKEGKKVCHKQIVYLNETELSYCDGIEYDEEIINLAIPTDNASVPLLVSTVKKIVETSSKAKGKIYFFGNKIRENHKEFVNNLLKKSNMESVWIDSGPYISRYKRIDGSLSEFDANVFSVFDIFHRFEKIMLVLPGILLNDDISEIYKIDLEGNLVAAPLDIQIISDANSIYQNLYSKDYLTEKLSLPDSYGYHCMDISIFNISKIKEKYSLHSIIELKNMNNYIQTFNDIINEKFAKRIKTIEMSWNVDVLASVSEPLFRWFIPNRLFEEYEASLGKKYAVNIRKCFPVVTHQQLVALDSSRFWEILKDTPYYELTLAEICSGIQNEQITINNNVSSQSRIRDFADTFFPKNTKRRKIIKKVFPKKDSKTWNLMKKIYYLLFPNG